jgi:membrane protein
MIGGVLLARAPDGTIAEASDIVRQTQVAELVRLARRVREEVKADNLSLIAAGVAFYGMLAVFPALIATVTLYGLVADPDRIRQQLGEATAALPQGAADVITGQLTSVVAVGRGGLTVGLVISLAATVWAAAGGVRALLLGLNIIFHVEEGRSLVRRCVIGLALTLGGLVAVPVALTLIAAFPVLLGRVGMHGVVAVLAQVARWVLLIVLVLGGLSTLYRWGPHRRAARWRWATPGTLVALALWGMGSVVFSAYVSNFGSYNETYGSLAAVIVLMLWLYLSAFAILVGAAVDAVRERDEHVIQATHPGQ